TASHFHLDGTAGIADSNIGTPTTSDGGSTWTVSIGGLGSADGTLVLDLIDSTGLDHSPTNLPFEGDAYTLDYSAPTVSGVPSDGPAADIDFQTSNTTLNANWAGVFADPGSDISGYEWKVGTTSGGNELFDFTTTGISGTTATATGLNLTPGQRYFVTVRATNGAGLQATATSDGVIAFVPSFVVNTTADELDFSNGVTSLREAIVSANLVSGSTITFDATAFASPKTITLGGSQLELTNTSGTTTITGPAAGVTVSGGGKSQVFKIDANVTATIS